MITVETIRERHSVREYDGKPLSRAEFDALGAVVEEYARESGLDIQLVGDNPEVFNVIARFGLIRGCRTHVAFVVDDGKARGVAADEAIGYWGPENRVYRARYGAQYVLVCAVLAQEIARCCGAGEENSPGHCGGPRENTRLFTEDEERRGAFFRRMREGAGVVCGGHGSRAAGTYGDE